MVDVNFRLAALMTTSKSDDGRLLKWAALDCFEIAPSDLAVQHRYLSRCMKLRLPRFWVVTTTYNIIENAIFYNSSAQNVPVPAVYVIKDCQDRFQHY